MSYILLISLVILNVSLYKINKDSNKCKNCNGCDNR